MKRTLNLALAILVVVGAVNAQNSVQSDINEPQTVVQGDIASELDKDKTNYEDAMDFMFDYNPESETYGGSFGYVFGKLGYWTFGMEGGGPEGVDVWNGRFGLGLTKWHVFDDTFLIQGKIYPYLGFSSVGMEEISTRYEFAYGLNANVGAGIKLFNSGYESGFLTLGYTLSAPKFRLGDMFDCGYWSVGLVGLF